MGEKTDTSALIGDLNKALPLLARDAIAAANAAGTIPGPEGEASEHLLEHVIARKRDAIELLERALR